MIELFKLDHSLNFPAHQLALNEPNGLLAFGGDLSPERLVHAYKHGIFPWFSEGEPILWWTPNPRGVIDLSTYTPSRSLKKSVRKFKYHATMNFAFEQVIDACAKIPREASEQIENPNKTWITDDMIHAYIDLHYMGHAHSVEIWDENDELVGGLYGVAMNHIFCGESMFHLKNDASKAALWALASHMKKFDMPMIDCQMSNAHLTSLGCIEIERDAFLSVLKETSERAIGPECWNKQILTL
ncbi:leucyl/phenylalanyl-tRNA--protein transferase [Agaribacter marinus]|uniref:Leucyl/phenylalanyl-tRNA--protein transferase n=1 Tax=Agaribacter marinus TaxID=1431249 RepID=A0AA37WIR8_9ALTE|nr:leucyl/phenylalanyl-tRNA--protein transferase [Agaribacter marinus]GLR69694.1 leucyl/phenylalanyl-tRNA--protein transferase [Agaribacter marinus]